MVEQQQAAPRGAVMAGAERQRRLDLDAELVGGDAVAVVLAVHDEAAGGDRDEVLEAGLDPVLGFDRVEDDGLAATSAPAALVTRSRSQAWSGGSAKCTVTSQRAVGPLEGGDRGLVFKKASVRRSTTRLARSSSPIAKLARWVAGVIEVIGNPRKNVEGMDGWTTVMFALKFEQISYRNIPKSYTGAVRATLDFSP